MNSKEIATASIKELINTYTQSPEGRSKKVEVLHDGFNALPKDTRKLIEGILKEVYRSDFEIVRKVFVEKLEIYLRLIVDALEEAGCIDIELKKRIGETREQIADVVNETEVSEENMKWLRRIGFLPVDIFELTAKLDISGVISELRENIDEYKLILRDEKYVVKILRMYEGLDKLKRLRGFYRNCDKDLVEFNGSHLSQIVLGAGWEEKLKYFEEPEKLKSLTEAGFNGYHLSQIVRNAGWEEKLKYFEEPEKLKRLTDAGFEASHLSQIVLGAGWKEKLKYFEEPEKLKRLTDAGFNGSHLSQIVRNSGWKEKLKYFEDPEKLKHLTDAGFNGSHLSQIVRNAGWKEKLKYFEEPEKLKSLMEAGFNGYHLSQIVLGAGWEEKLKAVLTESCLRLLRESILTHNENE